MDVTLSHDSGLLSNFQELKNGLFLHCEMLLATWLPPAAHARPSGLKRHLRREIFQKADIHTDILCNLVLDSCLFKTLR